MTLSEQQADIVNDIVNETGDRKIEEREANKNLDFYANCTSK